MAKRNIAGKLLSFALYWEISLAIC